MNHDYPIIDADVLIIGGGSAGAMAAIRAKEVDPAQKVVVFEKGHIKYSGCIARGMDALNIVAIPGLDTPELYVESNSIACHGVMDEPQAYEMAKRSFGLLKKLESWDVCFPTDKHGNYEVLQVHPKGKFCVTMKEPELKTILARRCHELGIEIVNRTMAMRLLKQGDAATGAIGMNVRTGEIVVCRARSVILSAGGTARFGLPNSGYLYGVYDFPGNTGDGYILAYKAGAELSGFEYTCTYYIVKDINAPLLYITLTRGAHLFNAFDQPFHESHPSIPMMHAEHQAHRGPMRIKLDHLPEDKIREIEDILFSTERPVQQRFYQGRDVDFRTGEIELWPTEVFLCGGHGQTGVRVNTKAESTVPGLYAAGDTSLVARGHLTGAFVYGEIAAENATEFAAARGPVELDSSQVEAFIRERDERGDKPNGKIPIEEFEYKVRRMINDYIVPPKNNYKLDRAIWWMTRFRKDLFEIVRVRDVHDLFKTYEVENIIQCALMSALASKERTESRWGLWHYRSDYPAKDEKWRKHIVLKMGGASPEDVLISHAPVLTL
ncbi:MAG: FAD-binding protein [Candidatus Abyssobacteria bacterium SURF_5]|uniref:FAD-binding protein n=1 Tax=Abyssobacteria bacterium (strain SURF_5) TaxID=2093360 RepID=A0A3A4NKF1_ABYX5|nr:MAG: FAD-binding protein [Candidatus Abyssubacteria bacterium SURF_5]